MSTPDDKTPPDCRSEFQAATWLKASPWSASCKTISSCWFASVERAFAVGASCTHYGGALARGVVAHGQICCPLHHARFALATGETTRAPALNPLACWNVEEVEGRSICAGSDRP